MSPKILLAVFTCHKYDYYHPNFADWFTRPIDDRMTGVRDTWLNDVTCDYKVFFGRPPRRSDRQPLADEVFLNCQDGYYYCNFKISGIVNWAVEHDYDYLLKVDDDVYLHWDRALRSGFERYDYVGGGANHDGVYVSGAAYWLSRKSMDVLYKVRPTEYEWAEDRWTGTNLDRAGIRVEHDDRYFVQRWPDGVDCQYVDLLTLPKNHNFISLHAMNPQMMREYHNAIRAPKTEYIPRQ